MSFTPHAIRTILTSDEKTIAKLRWLQTLAIGGLALSLALIAQAYFVAASPLYDNWIGKITLWAAMGCSGYAVIADAWIMRTCGGKGDATESGIYGIKPFEARAILNSTDKDLRNSITPLERKLMMMGTFGAIVVITMATIYGQGMMWRLGVTLLAMNPAMVSAIYLLSIEQRKKFARVAH